MQAQSPPMLGKYQLLRKIAAGGMAEVYLAAVAGPMGFNKKVVLKRILPHLADDQGFIGMFMSEAKLAAQLNHPNVVSIFDFGQEQGTWYIVMELIDGPNLRALFRRANQLEQPLDFTIAAKIVAMACEGLAYAHDFVDPESGQPLALVHRDISPDNILVSRAGAVKVVDFGIAKAANQTHHTKTGTVKGKFAYMPPEQLRGERLDCRADIFALGVVLYELICASKPFSTDNDAAIVQAILFGEWATLESKRPGTPPELQRIVDKALSRTRELRYQTCRELHADLEKYIASTGKTVSQYDVSEVVQKLAPPPPPTLATPLPQPSVAAPAPVLVSSTKETEEEPIVWSVVEVPPPVPEDATRPLTHTPAPSGAFMMDGARPLIPTPAPQPIPTGVQHLPPPVPMSQLQVPTQTGAGLPQPVPSPHPPPYGGYPQAPAPQLHLNVSLGQLEQPYALPQRKRPTLEVLPARKKSPVVPLLAALLAVGVGVGGVLGYKKFTQPAPVVEPPPVTPPPDVPVAVKPPEPVVEPPVKPPDTAVEPVAVAPPVEPVVEPPQTHPKKPPRGKRPKPKPKETVEVKPPPANVAGTLAFRVRPYATVYVNDKYLGDTPLKPTTLPTGQVTVRLVNKELGKDVRVPYEVKAGDNVFKYNLDD